MQVAHAALVQQAPVRIDHHRIADHRGLARRCAQIGDLRGQTARQQIVVAGAQAQELAAGHRHQMVQRGGDAAVLARPEPHRDALSVQRDPLGDARGGGVAGAVVDDHQFLVRVRILQHAVQAALHEAFVVVRRHQHRHQRRIVIHSKLVHQRKPPR